MRALYWIVLQRWNWGTHSVTTPEMPVSDATVSFYCCIYEVFSRKCCFFLSDTDLCSTDNGECSHNCTDLLPGRECSCYSGYVLNADGHTCNGNNSTLPSFT